MSRVLIVDDEQDLRESIRFALESRHEVEVASGGQEALEAIRAHEERKQPFDVILCDLMMPKLNGMALHGILRQENRRAAERMLFMSGGAVSVDSREFLDALPEDRVVSKPFTLKEIRAAVEKKGSMP